MNNKNKSILALIILITFAEICVLLILDWGLRKELIYYRNWKETFDSRYCPTCGKSLSIENEELK